MKDDDFDPDLSNFPAELSEKFMSFIQVNPDGSTKVVDEPGLFDFVKEHKDRYPFLSKVFKLNEPAIEEYFNRTGKMPPGIKGIRQTTQEGSNVTKAEIFWPEDEDE